MATHVFSNPYKNTQIFSTQGASLTYAQQGGSAGTSGNLPICTSQLTIQFARNITPMYSVIQSQKGGLTKYMAVGPGQGTLQLQGLFGPTTRMQKFLKACGQGCAPLRMQLAPFGEVCAKGDGQNTQKQICKIYLTGAICNTFGFSMQIGADGMSTVAVPLTFMITGLQWQDK